MWISDRLCYSPIEDTLGFKMCSFIEKDNGVILTNATRKYSLGPHWSARTVLPQKHSVRDRNGLEMSGLKTEPSGGL